ncbi:velvet factor-domain-containing protein [Dichotomocladium elegans]|nr:velvet factor-domain-containing protein [Dichotomocladium elegans]
MAGSVVQSLHKLKDVDDKDGGFFIFADISVRHEGHFKLKFTLFRIVENDVYRLCSVVSNAFQVYSPKTFPGMSESTFLTRCFSDQGVRIRIRKEIRTPITNVKRRRTDKESQSPSPHHEQRSRSPSQPDTINNAMSMQNLLLSESALPSSDRQTPPPLSPMSADYQYRYESRSYQVSLQLPPIQQQRTLSRDLFMEHSRATVYSSAAMDQDNYYQENWSEQRSNDRRPS